MENKDVVIQKRNAWADVGEFTHRLDLKLQAMAQASIKKIEKLPTTIEEIPAAREALKLVKQEKIQTETERKKCTSQLDALTTRLMLPEKSFDLPTQKYEAAIISIVKLEETKKAKEKLVADDLVKCKEYLTNHKTKSIADFNTKILAKVEEIYLYALSEKGNITMEGLPALLVTALGRFKASDFTITVPVNSFQHVTKEIYDGLCKDLLLSSPDVFIADYTNKINFKFSDYEIALTNKAQAMENSRIEKEAADKVNEEGKINAEIAAKLSAVAISPNITSSVKPLKATWTIEMEETLANSLIVMSAFAANIQTIQPMLKVNKFDSFNVGQMKTYIAKCKTLDENFTHEGIIFKQIDKL